MTIQLQKVQYTYANTTVKGTIQVWQYNCKKYNTRMTIQLQKVQYKYDNTTAKIVQYNTKSMYGNTTAKSTIYV